MGAGDRTGGTWQGCGTFVQRAGHPARDSQGLLCKRWHQWGSPGHPWSQRVPITEVSEPLLLVHRLWSSRSPGRGGLRELLRVWGSPGLAAALHLHPSWRGRGSRRLAQGLGRARRLQRPTGRWETAPSRQCSKVCCCQLPSSTPAPHQKAEMKVSGRSPCRNDADPSPKIAAPLKEVAFA